MPVGVQTRRRCTCPTGALSVDRDSVPPRRHAEMSVRFDISIAQSRRPAIGQTFPLAFGRFALTSAAVPVVAASLMRGTRSTTDAGLERRQGLAFVILPSLRNAIGG